jgi:hypothetical protein
MTAVESPIVHVFAVCWNEEQRLPYFLRHYDSFAQRIVVYDNQSTDQSVRLLTAHPRTECRTFDTGNEIRDDRYLEIKNEAWKESIGKADWVVVVDIDEFTYHPDIVGLLNRCREYTILRPYGYHMISEAQPTGNHPLTEMMRLGFREPDSDKPCIFRPDQLTINFEPGCHEARPHGNVREHREPELKMLHYRSFGREFTMARLTQYAQRMSAINKVRGWGDQYRWPLEEHHELFNRALAEATEVIG